jgi:nucleotide-binding universal stress UspA family protein
VSSTTTIATPEAPGPILAAAPDPVVVGYDGMLDGLDAVCWTLEELPVDTPIVVVSALGRERQLPFPLPRAERPDVLRARLEALWMEDAAAVDSELELCIQEGAPAEALVRVAQERGARLIVVGHRRRRRLGALQASVAHDVIERSSIPVVVVP